MNDGIKEFDDEIDLVDFVKQIGSKWKVLLGGAFLGCSIAASTILFSTPMYEAEGLVQIGKVAHFVGGLHAVQSSSIESSVNVVAQIESHAFQEQASEKIGPQRGRVLVNAVGSSSVVRVRALSSEKNDAVSLVKSSVELLIKQHEVVYKNHSLRVESEIDFAKQKLAVLEGEIRSMDMYSPRQGGKVESSNVTALGLLASIRLQMATEMLAIRQSIMMNELLLMPPSSQPTTLLQDVYVGDTPIYPRSTLVLILGLLGGLFFSTLFVLVKIRLHKAA